MNLPPSFKTQNPNIIGSKLKHSLVISQIDNAGIMLETKELCIYIDPISLDESYAGKPADIIFLTHDHDDHFEPSSIDIIKTEGTQIICPSGCSKIYKVYNVTKVMPENNSEILGIAYEVIKAYTNEPYHREALGFCGYILKIGGYVIFHGGDSTNIPEYEDITESLDVVCMDLGHNEYTIYEADAVIAIGVLQPKMLLPVHTFDRDLSEFRKACIEANPTTDIVTDRTLYLV